MGAARHLQAELQRRVRNVLSVITAIARRTAQTSETAEDYALHLGGRIGTIARAQGRMLRDPLGGLDLEQVLAEELLAHAAREGEQVSLSGPEIRLSGRAVEAIWLAVHELAVNAVKYGALSVPQGRIAVTWRVEDSPARPVLRLEWRERGGPPARAAPRRSGFGTEVIERTLAYQLGATGALSFEPHGLLCTITVPLSGLVSAPPF